MNTTAWSPSELSTIDTADDRKVSPLREHGGDRIHAAGSVHEVTVEPATDALADRIDDAYRAKYRRSPYRALMVSDPARAANSSERNLMKVEPKPATGQGRQEWFTGDVWIDQRSRS